MKKILPFALMLVTGAWMYACSSDDTTNNAENPGGGDGDGDDDGQNPGDGNNGDTDGGGGGNTDGGGGGGGDNPIEGIAAPKMLADWGSAAFIAGPQWNAAQKKFWFSLPLAAGPNPDTDLGMLQTVGMDGAFNPTPLRSGNKTTTGVQGNSVDKAGNLISTELTKLTRTTPAGVVSDIVTGWTSDAGAETFNKPKDLVARLSDNTIYFTDPGYGADPPDGVNKLFKVSPAGVATLLDSFPDVPRPNGIALSKDEKTLYVDFTSPSKATADSPSVPFIRSYTVNTDGSLKDPKKFAELPADSAPDGLAIDEKGNLYVAFKGGVNVYSPDGTKLGSGAASIPLAQPATGVAFGGDDRKTLLITTDAGKFYTVNVNVPGLAQ